MLFFECAGALVAFGKFEIRVNGTIRIDADKVNCNVGKRHPPRGCRAEFDYTGWSNYNIWRREVKRIIAERNGLVGAISTTKGRWSDSDSDFDDLYLPLTPRWKERNCWIDCSFPSECHNYRARLLREKALLSTRWEEQRQREEVEVALFRDVYWREGSGVEEKGGEKGDGGEKADLSEEELKSLYLDMVVKGSDEPDVRIQDCDGLGEQGYRLEYTRSKRRKSIEALVLGDDGAVGAAEPNSPLKEEWGGEDGKVWEDVDLDEEDEDEENIGRGRSKERKPVNEDEQMREALLARSMFLRRFDWDDGGEKFGDEDESERI